MLIVRRLLTLVAFAFWQGGFTFYTAVVVPLGTGVLGSPAEQGRITREVSVWLNVAGAVAVVFLLWDALATRPWRRSRTACVILLALGLAALFYIYPRLDVLFDHDLARVRERGTFRPLHKTYLWISTVQWMVGVVYLALTPAAWRAADIRPDSMPSDNRG
jgi:hypothetical protein